MLSLKFRADSTGCVYSSRGARRKRASSMGWPPHCQKATTRRFCHLHPRFPPDTFTIRNRFFPRERESRMAVMRFDHVNILTADIDAARDFFIAVLGLRPGNR